MFDDMGTFRVDVQIANPARLDGRRDFASLEFRVALEKSLAD
jgi:hypothetical protein